MSLVQPRFLKNYSLFVDGEGLAGLAIEARLPDLQLVTEDHRAGGMDAPVAIDLGMEGLEFGYKLAEQSPIILRKFGLNNQNGVSVTLRASMTGFTGSEDSYMVNARGMITGVNQGTLASGSKNEMDVTMRLVYYKLSQRGRVIHEIDILNMRRIINGVDQLAARRANMAL